MKFRTKIAGGADGLGGEIRRGGKLESKFKIGAPSLEIGFSPGINGVIPPGEFENGEVGIVPIRDGSGFLLHDSCGMVKPV